MNVIDQRSRHAASAVRNSIEETNVVVNYLDFSANTNVRSELVSDGHCFGVLLAGWIVDSHLAKSLSAIWPDEMRIPWCTAC